MADILFKKNNMFVDHFNQGHQGSNLHPENKNSDVNHYNLQEAFELNEARKIRNYNNKISKENSVEEKLKTIMGVFFKVKKENKSILNEIRLIKNRFEGPIETEKLYYVSK